MDEFSKTAIGMFKYKLSSEYGYENDVFVKLWFRISMISPALGIDADETLIILETDPFQLRADLWIDSRDLSNATNTIYDVNGNAVASGMYIYALQGEGLSITKKMVLMK